VCNNNVPVRATNIQYRHCERRCISEAIHAASPRRTPMDCRASIKPFEARNDVCPFASPSFAPPSLRATFYQRSDPYGITTVHTMDCHASIKSFEARNDICSSKSSPSAPRHCERLHISEAIHTLNPLRLLAMRHPSAASMALIESTQAR